MQLPQVHMTAKEPSQLLVQVPSWAAPGQTLNVFVGGRGPGNKVRTVRMPLGLNPRSEVMLDVVWDQAADAVIARLFGGGTKAPERRR